MRLFLSLLTVAALVITSGAAVNASSDEEDEILRGVWTETGIEALDAEAQAPAAPQPAPRPAPGSRLRRWLELSDDQARRVEQILAGHRSRTERLRIDLARARLDAREAMLPAQPDRARLDTVARRIGELHGQLTRARFDLELELRTVLTPEQQARWRAGMARMRERLRSRF